MVREVREENLPKIKEMLSHWDSGEEKLKTCTLWYYLLDDQEVAVLGVENSNHISVCYTQPEYRGKGAAKELFEAVKTILLARGFFEITADATEESRGFFQKLGFRTTEENGDRFSMVYRF